MSNQQFTSQSSQSILCSLLWPKGLLSDQVLQYRRFYVKYEARNNQQSFFLSFYRTFPIIEQEIGFALVISSLLSGSAVEYREVWNLMHPLWLDLCQDAVLLSYTRLAVASVHLSAVQLYRHIDVSTYTQYPPSPPLVGHEPHTHFNTTKHH